jgi:hypothetical protein
LNPGIGPKVIVKKLSSGPVATAAEAACRHRREVCRRACARAGIAPGGKAGGSGDRVSACGDGAKAGSAGRGGGAGKKKGKGWCDRRVTEEEEILTSQD